MSKYIENIYLYTDSNFAFVRSGFSGRKYLRFWSPNLLKLKDFRSFFFWSLSSYRTGFLGLRIIEVLGWIICCFESCSVHCRTFNSNPGLYQLGAINILPPHAPPAVTTKNISSHCQNVLRGSTSFPFPSLHWEPLLWEKPRVKYPSVFLKIHVASYLGR